MQRNSGPRREARREAHVTVDARIGGHMGREAPRLASAAKSDAKRLLVAVERR